MNKGLIKHVLFWLFYLTAFWGAFEMAYDAGCNPLWSAVWGFPIPHHYVTGFIGLALTYFLFTKDDWDLEGLLSKGS